MAQDYGKIFREVLKDIFPAIAQKVLGIAGGRYTPLPVDLQYTSEREADQVWEVTPDAGAPFVLHCELQTGNNKGMLPRMLLYYGFLYFRKRLAIRQYVVYVGREPVQMEYVLNAENMAYAYHLVDLKAFPYQNFLASDRTEEVVLAVLADFAGEPGALVAQKIIARLEMLSGEKLELSQRTLQLIPLAALRNLSTTVLNIARNMALDIDITEDALYLLGEQKGEQRGLQKGKEEGLQEGKEEGLRKGKEEVALQMLRKGMAVEFISGVTELSTERIAQLNQQLQAGR
jgi:predicted transposase/invertase (TIGR01784 family)